MKTNLSAILLLFCLVAPLTMTLAWLRHQKAIVRREVKGDLMAGMDKEELVLLKFTEKEGQEQVQWKHSKEFEYKGQMYDIVDTEIHGDTTYYWCWPDHKETKLDQQLNDLFAYASGNNQQSKDTQQRLANFLKSLYPPGPGETLLVFSQPVQERFYYDFSCIAFSSSPPVPPPEIG